MRSLALLLLLSSACLPFDLGPSNFDFDSSACFGDVRDFSGTWTILGDGSRSRCEDERFDTTFFEIRSQPLVFVQSGSDFVFDRVASGVDTDFRVVDAEVRGGCARFTTVEDTSLGAVRIEWEAAGIDGAPQLVEGEFSGTGPESCQLTGSFQADIVPPP